MLYNDPGPSRVHQILLKICDVYRKASCQKISSGDPDLTASNATTEIVPLLWVLPAVAALLANQEFFSKTHGTAYNQRHQ